VTASPETTPPLRGAARLDEPRAVARIAVVAAFPFPLPQGSQVFVREQLRALARAGAEPTLFCYGSGAGPAPADLRVVRVPRALSPRALRAGPSAGKPVADALLAAAFAAESRRHRFDAVLAHNGEAALAALLARRASGCPVVYVAHTLLVHELEAYGPTALAPSLRALGAGLDRTLASRADAVIALSTAAGRRLARFARGPVEVIPPGLDPAPPPDAGAMARARRRAGVETERFALYAGNLDRYQDLDDLGRAARQLPELPVVVATHATGGVAPPGLRVLRATDAEEVRALTFAAAVAVAPRQRPGGFPIKLLNYMEAGRPIVARAAAAPGLEHGRSAWLLSADAGPSELASALRTLARDPERAAELGRAARAVLESRHAWRELAARTLAFASGIRSTGA
jgi:glycosyltransferase involved in cell wall biosynthesis